jgi:hypothetical protein
MICADGTPDWDRIRQELSAPFPEDEVGQVPIDKSGRLLGKYITARAVMDRLDSVVGPENWSDDYEKWDDGTCAVKCTITVFGIKRSDVGYPNDPSDADNAKREPFKAACSDALKRAAVHWGIARYLYPKPGERGVSPDAAARVSRPASEKQISYLRRLAESNDVRLPSGGQLEGLPMDVASRWIDELQANGPNAVLSGWGEEAPERSALRERGSQDRADGAEYRSDFSRAYPPKPASANQLATIAKLSRLLGRPEEPNDDMTSAEASERITELSREYNERKATPSRRSA